MKNRLIILLCCIFFIGCGNDDGKTSLPPPTITPTPPPLPRICDPITTTSSATSNPLYNQQWYLNNTGQTAYSCRAGVVGVDLNLTGVTQTGRGVVVNVVDSGMEITHEDLRANVIDGSINFNGGTDPTNTEDDDGDHGTSVAGIIAASSNNLGGRGVAPEASLIAYNLLQNQPQINNIRAILATADINNQSYGSSHNEDIRIVSAIEDAYIEGTKSGRNSKGKIYIKAAGNGFNSNINIKSVSCTINTNRGFIRVDEHFTQSPISCENANMGPLNTLPYNIVVAAMNARGVKSSYSTTGSAILVSGFGGEFGNDHPAMITTDQSGCNKGYARHSSRNDFDKGSTPNINQNCNYTNTFNGTSSAAPTVAGVIALMLEANSNLTWRDVRHILVSTSKKVDASRDAIKTKSSISNIISEATADLGWTRNTAGHEFHNWYGFGLVDASAAVTMSQNYTSRLEDFQKIVATNDSSSSIPDKNFVGANSIIHFNNNLTIESIQIDIQVTHPFTADLGIWLKSPNGTESILLTPFNNFASYNRIFRVDIINRNLNMVLASQAFYGEDASGDWELKVIDYWSESTGDLYSWKLIVYGH